MRRTVVCTTDEALVLSSLKEPLRQAYFSICMQHSSFEDETFINLSKWSRVFLDCTVHTELRNSSISTPSPLPCHMNSIFLLISTKQIKKTKESLRNSLSPNEVDMERHIWLYVVRAFMSIMKCLFSTVVC